MNEYDGYDDDYHAGGAAADSGLSTEEPLFLQPDEDLLLQQQQDVDFDDPAVVALPRVLLMGPRRGGKTSIQVRVVRACVRPTSASRAYSVQEERTVQFAGLFWTHSCLLHPSSRLLLFCCCSFLSHSMFPSSQRVVFQKMSPHETLFRLEATQGLEKSLVDHTPLCRFTIWDFPGDYYGEESDENDDNDDDAVAVFEGSTSLIFVVDAQDEPYDHVLQSFTTAVTRALQVNPNIAVEVFINKVDGELFLSDESKYDCRRDVMTQVTDELAEAGVGPDAVQIRYHLTSIYDHSIYEALSRVVQRLIPQLPTLENLLNVLVSTCSMEKAYLFDVVSKLYISTDSGPVDMQSVELCSDMIDVVLDVSGIYGLGPSHEAVRAASLMMEGNDEESSGGVGAGGAAAATDETLINPSPAESLKEDVVDPDSAYDNDSASVIRLSNGMVRMRGLSFVTLMLSDFLRGSLCFLNF